MTLFHDAYLFNLEAFANKAASYLPNPEAPSNYARLRTDAIQVYEENPLVRILLGDYGGWAKSAFTQIVEAPPLEAQDIAFWLVILLYDKFKSSLHQLGLGGEWRTLQQTLGKIGWSESEATLLITGQKFRGFEQISSLSVDYWNYFKPFSTSSSMGWISLADINIFLDKLNQDEQKLHSLIEVENVALISKSYRLAQTMLNAAKDQNTDLCLIISG